MENPMVTLNFCDGELNLLILGFNMKIQPTKKSKIDILMSIEGSEVAKHMPNLKK